MESDSSEAVSEALSREPSSRIAGLKRLGHELSQAGRFDEAIHIWTRLLFLDRGNLEAKRAIEAARRAIAERQRRLDLDVAEASRLFDAGDLEAARALVSAVLAADAGHTDAAGLSARLAAHERRVELSHESIGEEPAVDPVGGSRGVLLRVPKGSPVDATSRRPVASRLAMGAFVAAAAVVFAAFAIYLSDNWDSLVSGGAFGQSAGSAPVVDPVTLPVPAPADLHYFNGVRLFGQERYREALAELSRVERGSPYDAEARSLIVRIEERLLRSADQSASAPGGGE